MPNLGVIIYTNQAFRINKGLTVWINYVYVVEFLPKELSLLIIIVFNYETIEIKGDLFPLSHS